MIGRKLLFVTNIKENHMPNTDEIFLSKILDFDKIKHLFIENLKKT